MDELFPGCDPIFGEADFYAVVEISGTEFDNKNTPEQDALEQNDDISPNWEFSQPVDFASGAIPVKIRIFDEDGFLRGDDDEADLDPGAGRDLIMSLTPSPCGVTGDVTGSCGTTLISAGTDNDSAELSFRIDVVEPPSAPGLNVQCIHSPIWPQSTDTITITANALDGSFNSKIADTIEIWVNSTSAPATSTTGATTLASTVGPFAGPTFSYGCRIIDDGVAVFTGWRTVAVGGPPAGQPAVPVLITGPTSSRLDIVFIADSDNFTGASDPNFLTAVGSVILNSYYDDTFGATYGFFLSNQDKFNFWISPNMGDAEAVTSSSCPHTVPDGTYLGNAGAILHTDNFRDCAPGGQRLFSSEPTSLATVLHESGHRPFGLADEYCCDGGYFQNGPNPDLYESLGACTGDPTNAGKTCRTFTDNGGEDWYTSDPASGDLMVDNQTPQQLDIRRMNWLFGECARAGC